MILLFLLYLNTALVSIGNIFKITRNLTDSNLLYCKTFLINIC